MNRMKISTRLLMVLTMLGIFMISIGTLGLVGISKTNDALKTVYEDRTVPAAQIGEIGSLVLHNRLAAQIALLTPTPEVIAQQTAQVDANIGEITRVWTAYMATHLTAEERDLAQAFAEARKAFIDGALVPAVRALRRGDLPEAQRLMVEVAGPLTAVMETKLDALTHLQIEEARKEYTSAEARYETIRVASIAAIVIALAVSAVLGSLLTISITRQLGAEPAAAATLANGIAAGDLGVQISVRPGDTTSLMAQLLKMRDSLGAVVTHVRSNSDGVATASVQIAQGNQDLSQRTEEQAAALEETASSMEQLGATVRRNADNASQASQLAQGASAIACEGGELVARVVDTMKGINDSSKKVADIIGVIDGIAFQTNILALNAAVEAARAGQQGRGFAVVASEVRNLAQRSAQAAKEIKNLITTSVEQVEQGASLVDQAGETMGQIVTAIKKVSDVVGEISVASVEQSAGVAQIGQAVSQMDQVTQQNAALVEEGAAAAESLKLQAQQLVHAVAVFKLSGQAAATTDDPVEQPHAPRTSTQTAPVHPARGVAAESFALS